MHRLRLADIGPSHGSGHLVRGRRLGRVWKTTNAGTIRTPIFEDQPSYSIGEITLDPTNPEVVWVGTGKNVSGRHVGWGDGVYRSGGPGSGLWKSVDNGKTWRQLKTGL